MTDPPGPAGVIEREMAAVDRLARALGPEVQVAVSGKVQARDGAWWRVTLERLG